MSYRWIEVEPGRIATVRLNRPEKRNAFHDGMIAELLRALDRLECESVRVVLLTAAGDHFSAGADLAWMRRMAEAGHEQNRQDALQLARLMQRLAGYPRPLVCLVQGACYGGGVGLAAASAITLAADDARFCLSEVKLGLVPAVIGPYLARAMGARSAGRYMLGADVFDGQQACRLGLVHETCPAAELEQRGRALAGQMASHGPRAMQACLKLMRQLAPVPDPTLMEATADLIATVRAGDEAQAGMRAFFERRTPLWQEPGP